MNPADTASTAQRPPLTLRAVALAAGASATLFTGLLARGLWRSTHWLWQRLPGVHMADNRGNDGPPDLDELWRDFNRKLSGVFQGRQGGGDGPGGNMTPDPTGAGLGIGLVAGLMLVVWLGSGVFIVQEGQQGVVMSFGSYSHTVNAGFQFRMPWPVQSHEVVNVTQLRSVDVGGATVTQGTGLRDSSMLTKDENIIDIQFTVQYRLADVRQYLFENRNADEAVLLAAESAVREIVGSSTMDSVLYERRDAISTELVTSIQTQLDRRKAGIAVVSVNVKNVQPPEQVQAAFDDAVKAGADRERLKNEGQAYANDVIPKAQGTAARLREEAAGYSARVVAQAEGDAQRFKLVVTEYQKAPAVTRDRLYIDTMQQVLSNVTKVMSDARSGTSLINLPLDRILQSLAVGANGVGTSSAPASNPGAPVQVETGNAAGQGAATASIPAPEPRSRENLRTRDRETR